MLLHRKFHKLGNRLTVGLFLLVLVAPALDMVLHLDPTPKVQGMFKPPKLELTPRGLLRLPFDFKNWFAENFGFRGMLIQQHGLFKDRVLDMSPSHRVVRGTDGWYFFNDEGAMEDYRNLTPFTEPQLQTWTRMLAGRYNYCKDKGIPYLFTMSPNKHTIYSEFLPPDRYQVTSTSRLDQLKAAMAAEHPEIPFVDVRQTLLMGKKQHRLYHKTDTHWNETGAYLAYLELAAELKKQFPQLELPPADFEVEMGEDSGGDLARFMGLKFVIKEETVTPVRPKTRRLKAAGKSSADLEQTADLVMTQVIETSCEQGEIDKGLIFHDSFGRALLPYLAPHFKHAVFVWTNDFSPQMVDQEQPDVVIQQLVERRTVSWTPPQDEFAQTEVDAEN